MPQLYITPKTDNWLREITKQTGDKTSRIVEDLVKARITALAHANQVYNGNPLEKSEK